MSGIVFAALAGAAGGAIGWLISLLLPGRARAVVIGVCIALAAGSSGFIRQAYERETMTPTRFEAMVTEQLRKAHVRIADLLQLYKAHEPDLYAKIMTQASDAFRKGSSRDSIADVVRTQIMAYMGGRLRELSDDGILLHTDLIAAQMDQLGKEGRDDVCMKMVRNEPLGAMTPSNEMIELEYRLVEGALLDPGGSGEAADRPAVDAAVNAAIASLAQTHGQGDVQRIFGAISDRMLDPKGGCAIFANYFRELKKAAEPRSAQVLRAIFMAPS